jgi:SpoVK/Ycf46/Vps4 family AAA+-type ATPase
MDPSKRENILFKVAKVTHGFVPTDLQALCVECALALIAQVAAGQPTSEVDMSYFDRAVKTIRPSGMGEFLSKVHINIHVVTNS